MKEYLVKNGNVAGEALKVTAKAPLGVMPKAPQERRDMDRFAMDEVLDPKVLTSLMTGIVID